MKTAVAMSGGVDSSVAAALLLEAGHDVFGVTMRHYDSPCRRAESAVADAARVCKSLGIDHHVIEMREQFMQLVIENFVSEYLAGRTPNPCVRCNATIKWGELLNAASALGAERIATGHYVMLRFDEPSGRYQLVRSQHRAKDQSYALWRLTQEQLARTLFPIADMPKNRVREKAASLGLDIAHKAESQDICFIPDDDYAAFIVDLLATRSETPESGEIIDAQGRVLGRHRGYPFYTIGQRKGLGIALGRPQYVVSIDATKNQIRVGNKEDLLSAGLVSEQTNWVSIAEPTSGAKVSAHIRYNDPGHPATIMAVDTETVTVQFDEPRPAVTPGQSAVFYDGDLLIGGGIIARSMTREDLEFNSHFG